MERIILHVQNSSITRTINRLFKRSARGLDLRLISEGETMKQPDDFRPTVEDLFESHLHTYARKYHRDHVWQPDSGFHFFSTLN